jgi:hypothetical protein
MSLEVFDVAASIVAELSHSVLNRDPDVIWVGSPMPRSGPGIFVFADDEWSAWAELTTSRGRYPARLEILKEWRICGDDNWRSKPNFLNGTVYMGPHNSFVEAARWRDEYEPSTRPEVSDEGLEQIREWLLKKPDIRRALEENSLLLLNE